MLNLLKTLSRAHLAETDRSPKDDRIKTLKLC